MLEQNCWASPKQLWKTSENDFFDPQKGQKLHLKTAKMSKFLSLDFDFRGHISTFLAENTPKVGLLRPKTILKQLLRNSSKNWKSPENDYYDTQKGQKLPLKTAKMSKFLTLNFDFKDHITTFRAENKAKRVFFKAKNNAQKSPENDFFDPQKGQKWPLKTAKMSKILTLIFYFRGHISTFQTENTPKSGPFKAENNALSTIKQLSKSPENWFFEP